MRGIFEDVSRKELARFPTSITDFWGRSLSYQLVDAPSGGPGFTISSIAEDREFSSAKTPLPLIIADARLPGEILIPANATIFEFSPWELGYFDSSSINGFAPLKYFGSRFYKVKLPKGEKCISGFDNVGFVKGTSSSLFNEALIALSVASSSSTFANRTSNFILEALKGDALQALQRIADPINRISSRTNWDISTWSPNPFKGWNRRAIA